MAADWSWDEKLLLLRALLHPEATSESNFFERLFAEMPDEKDGSQPWSTFYGKQHKWKKASKPISRPNKSKDSAPFFDIILREIGIENRPWIWFVDAGVMDIVQALPKHLHPSLTTETLDQINSARKAPRPFHLHYQHLKYDVLSQRETAFQGSRFLDQQFCYLSAECVQRWRQLIVHDEYQNFINCLQALRKCVTGQHWRNFINSSDANRVLMLGGGSGEKSNTIIQSIVKIWKDQKIAPPAIEYAIVDASAFMCESDMRFLYKGDVSKRADTINITTYQLDFTDPKMLSSVSHAPNDRLGARTAFFILGCTIGNINEGDLLRALSAASQPGDVLVIGTEFVDAPNLKTYSDDLLSRYDTDEMRDVVLYPLHHDLDKAGVSNDVSTRRDIVSIGVKDLDPSRHMSSFSRGLTVEAKVDLHRGNVAVDAHHEWIEDVTLMISKRYYLEDFIKFIDSYGFMHIVSEDSSYEPYKQIYFERRAQEDERTAYP